MNSFSISVLKLGRPSFLTRQSHLLNQGFVVALFAAQDVVEAVLLQLTDMRSIWAQGILSDREGQLRMVLLQLGQETLGCVPLTVVLRFPILLHNRLGHQRNHFPSVRVNDDPTHQLMGVGHLSRLLGDLLQTGITGNLLRAKVPCALQRNEVAAPKKKELACLASDRSSFFFR